MASALLAAGWRVGVVARPATVAALRAGGLRRSGIFGEVTHLPGSFAVAPTAAELLDEFDGPPGHVLVCVKSFDTAVAAGDLAGKALAGTRFVLCQNGWGNAEEACRYLPAGSLYSARIITGFRRPELHHVEITVHALTVRIGSLFHPQTGAVAELCEALTQGGLPTEPTATIGRDLWAKLLYNAMLNPLGAILGVPYGVLGEQPGTRAIMESVLREAWAVMIATGHGTHWHGPEAFLEAFYGQQLPTTARHRSSMLQDLEAGRRTEIAALNGAILRLGGGNIATPVNETLVRMVEALEKKGG